MFDVVRSRWNHSSATNIIEKEAEDRLTSMNDAGAVHAVYHHRRLFRDLPS